MKRTGATCSICGKHGRGFVFHWNEETQTWVCKQCTEQPPETAYTLCSTKTQRTITTTRQGAFTAAIAMETETGTPHGIVVEDFATGRMIALIQDGKVIR